MRNELRLFPIIKEFKEKIDNQDFVIDKSGVEVVEIIASKVELNPAQPIIDFGVKKTNKDYVEKELKWYLSQSLSIIGYVDDVKIWNDVATKDEKKEVNSNYGWCIFSKENGSQYDYVLNELKLNPYSRRANMIYTRPSMNKDYNRNGMSDFMCTNYVSCFIRDNRLVYNVHQRSCDFVYGFLNDFAWHCYVYNKLLQDLKTTLNVHVGTINYICDSLHCYEKHFDLIQKIYLSF